MKELCEKHIEYAKYMHRESIRLNKSIACLIKSVETLTNIVEINERRLDRIHEKVRLLQEQTSTV